MAKTLQKPKRGCLYVVEINLEDFGGRDSCEKEEKGGQAKTIASGMNL